MTSWSPSLELPAGCDPAPALPAPAVATVAAIVGSDITAGTAEFSGVLQAVGSPNVGSVQEIC